MKGELANGQDNLDQLSQHDLKVIPLWHMIEKSR
jgi:hypothetical protein